MSDIKLVIKIPELYYKEVKTTDDFYLDSLGKAIKNGKPLESLIGTEILKAKQNITVGKEDYNMGIYVGLIKALNLFEDKESEEQWRMKKQLKEYIDL